MKKAKPKINSRRKGKTGELEAAAYLTRLGFTARRGQQHKGGADSPDVVSDDLRHVHLEVKRVQSIDLGTKELAGALDQASRDAGGAPYAVLWRRNRKPWCLTWDDPSINATMTVTGDHDITRLLRALERYGASLVTIHEAQVAMAAKRDGAPAACEIEGAHV